MSVRKEGFIKTNWGYEITWSNTENYCGKIMVFEKAGSKFGMHFHKNKHESWFINSGKFFLRYINTQTGILTEKILSEGDTWHNPPLLPHQLEAMQADSAVFVVSTTDFEDDTYMLMPENNQKDDGQQ